MTEHLQSLARMGARTLGVDASESNIGIASAHASADPELSSTGELVYQNTCAEELVREPKRYDVVCSMEVLEHVDNPAGFLSTCAELVKVCIVRTSVVPNTAEPQSLPAGWPSFPVDYCSHAPLLLSNHLGSRARPAKGRSWDPYIFQIHQPFGTGVVLLNVLFTIPEPGEPRKTVDNAHIQSWPPHTHRG